MNVFGDEQIGRSDMKHILLATDGSSGAERAADVAAELAKATGARLSIMTVGDNTDSG